MSVVISSSLLNMLMNETEGRTQILKVGKDTLDITWLMVIIQDFLVTTSKNKLITLGIKIFSSLFFKLKTL